jgi:hypothetical protein
MAKFNRTDLDIKKVKVKLPFQLTSHPGFSDAKIRVDEDQIHFSVQDNKKDMPDLWIYDNETKSWANVEFLTDKAV